EFRRVLFRSQDRERILLPLPQAHHRLGGRPHRTRGGLMARQSPEQAAAIAAFTQWYHEKQASDAELEAEVARFRAEQKIRRETALNIKGVSVYDALVSTGARKGHMADALGVSRPTLYRILEGLEE